MISKDKILKIVNIKDVASYFGIELERVSSGSFDYRCRCPSKDHKHGSERTSSCYINSSDNNFYCFGCNAGYNVIDFCIISGSLTFSESMAVLRSIAPDCQDDGSDDARQRGQSNFPILIDLYSLMRRYSKYFLRDEWMVSFSKKVDSYVDNIDTYDIIKTKKLYYSVKDKLVNRYGEL